MQQIRLFTIGFTKKSAEIFFTMLKTANIRTLIDIRLQNTSQLAGYAKRDDLEFFLKHILDADYRHLPQLAPTREILDDYKKKKIGWSDYEKRFLALLEKRAVEKDLDPQTFHMACLLCAEPAPDHCHRNLVAHYLKEKWKNITIDHLVYKE